MIKLASHYNKINDTKVQCQLCPAFCTLELGKTGICGCRYNQNGELFTENYGEVVTIAVDPIEKKPLYHFYPGSTILSTGANGCNFTCDNCQNWSISQRKVSTVSLTPQQLVHLAEQHNTIGVAFTYTEPTIWFEYLYDSAALLRKAGLKTVLVSNGYINPAPLAEILPRVDAFNIDLKSMRSEFYKTVCNGKIEPVLENIQKIASSGAHLELTFLIIPGKNDSEEEINDWVDFVASVSPDIPVHFSGYHPDYKMEIEATPRETLLQAMEIAQKKLTFVYLGNVAGTKGKNSYCPNCQSLLIERTNFHINVSALENSTCQHCQHTINVIQDVTE